LEGYEQWGYDNYDASGPNSPRRRGVGLGLGYDAMPRTVPEALNCPKFLHVLFMGANLNCKIGEILDFLLGWTTLDIGKDDEYLGAGPAAKK